LGKHLYRAVPPNGFVVHMPEKKKTSIKIDPELWKEAKIEAIRREVDVSDFVEDALRKELGFPKELTSRKDELSER